VENQGQIILILSNCKQFALSVQFYGVPGEFYGDLITVGMNSLLKGCNGRGAN
jgi:hypothetical protein